MPEKCENQNGGVNFNLEFFFQKIHFSKKCFKLMGKYEGELKNLLRIYLKAKSRVVTRYHNHIPPQLPLEAIAKQAASYFWYM
jgi:hypothetical protein